MRILTKSVAGDREAPSFESRWMWRYPVGRAARLRVCCPPPCRTSHPRGWGPAWLRAGSPWKLKARRTVPRGLDPVPPIPANPTNLASSC